MRFEKSCGAVLFAREAESLHYLIIRHTGGHCGFPKGHMESGESEQETALREVREEVGLQVCLIDGFRAEDSYPLPNRPDTRKQVVYFLAEFTDQQVRIQPEEISAAYTVSYEEAQELLPFPEAKRILTQAHRFLTEQL